MNTNPNDLIMLSMGDTYQTLCSLQTRVERRISNAKGTSDPKTKENLEQLKKLIPNLISVYFSTLETLNISDGQRNTVSRGQ